MKHDSGRLLILEEMSLPGTSVTDSCRVTAVSGAAAKQEIIPGTMAEIKHISEPNWIWKKNLLLSIVSFGGKTWRCFSSIL